MIRQSAVRASSLLTSSALRTSQRPSSSVRIIDAARTLSTSSLRRDAASTAPTSGASSSQGHAVSNPTLANIEKRWEEMPPQEQAELWMALRDRMTVDWHQMTMQEKRASYWIAFGPHGPRALPDPNQNWEVLKLVTISLIASGLVFATIRYFARPPPKTMTKEWQEMSNEYLKAQGSEAITGVSWEGYEGPGMVQSAPGLDKYKTEEDE